MKPDSELTTEEAARRIEKRLKSFRDYFGYDSTAFKTVYSQAIVDSLGYMLERSSATPELDNLSDVIILEEYDHSKVLQSLSIIPITREYVLQLKQLLNTAQGLTCSYLDNYANDKNCLVKSFIVNEANRQALICRALMADLESKVVESYKILLSYGVRLYELEEKQNKLRNEIAHIHYHLPVSKEYVSSIVAEIAELTKSTKELVDALNHTEEYPFK